ncbi:hypothetical protein FP2506_08481 [Fulvimarina pelagi HTCC2506]|uniref:Uncharacterized protein n=1 Tax=Fulvimarina pelagi HTCC2506 TaxID=314231 RepID=Q0G650_9HYPH|nr:hypothetical protein [Fulvimarina pelagi]EAU42864.1 hypothetical protein FP2506_08481 [Fulvimarina pelagi HTCC2506]
MTTPKISFRPVRCWAWIAAALCIALAQPAFAQRDESQPRDIPEGFVLPGPAPTNAPNINPDGTVPDQESPNPANQPETQAEPDTESAETSAPTSQGGSLAPTTSTVVGEGQRAANPMAFATAPETGTTDWPCVQREVETIQAAQMWAGPDLSLGNEVERTPEMRAIVDRAIARRISGNEAQTLVREYIDAVPEGDREAVAAALFGDILDRLNAERGQVMNGILRYGSRQKQLADALRSKAARMAELRREGDATAFADIREEIAWDTRVFDDRRQSLTYVCEVPILIEQRAFALGRELSRGLG